MNERSHQALQKCIKDELRSSADVKSFLQTVQFIVKFMGRGLDQLSYPELTDPLCVLTSKHTRFTMGQKVMSFQLTVEKANRSDDLANYLDLTFIIESNN